MNWLKIISTFTLILISFAANCPEIHAENTSNRGSSNPSGGGRSGRRVAGSDRGNCPVVKIANKSLTALVPEPKNNDAVTISDSPTLLFYVPYASTSPIDARFSLQDDRGYNVIKPPIQVKLSETPGIVRVQLPKSLEKGKVYHWYFAIICESTNQSKNPVVDGWIARVEPSPMASQLTQKLSPRELAAVYRKEGILVDALALLAETRYSDLRTLDDWNSLLRSLDLEAISTEKILQCCTAKQ